MNRTIKTIKLIQLLSETYDSFGSYVHISEITEKLETDERNVRKIVKMLRDDLNLSIESKKGLDGGYRVNENVFASLMGIEYLSDLSEDMLSIINESNRSFTYKTDVIKNISKFMGANTPDSYNILAKDFDYLHFVEEVKRDSVSFILIDSTYCNEPCHLEVTYLTTKGIIKYNAITLSNEVISGFEYFIVLDIDTKKLRFVDLRFLQNIDMVYGDYPYDTIFEKIKDRQYDEMVVTFNKTIIEKQYSKVIIKGNLSKKTSLILNRILGAYFDNIPDLEEFYLPKSKLPLLYMQDIPELSESLTYDGELMLTDDEFQTFFKLKYKTEGDIILDEDLYIEYNKQFTFIEENEKEERKKI